MFLVLLLFATHVMVNLWAHALVEDISDDTVKWAAQQADFSAEPATVERRAIDRARTLLGSRANQVDFQFSFDGTSNSLTLHVSAPGIGWADSPIGSVDTSFSARVEDR